NGGTLMEPSVIKKVEMVAQGGQAKAFSPRIVRRVISTETAKIMQAMMRRVVEQGTGVKAQVKGYSVCGKTGTAQKLDPKIKKYSSDKYVASFCGFLPAENPKLVC